MAELTEERTRELADRVMGYIRRGPFFFYDILQKFDKEGYRDLLIAWSTIRSREKFERDGEGRYILKV
jgi:hypothetical protein